MNQEMLQGRRAGALHGLGVICKLVGFEHDLSKVRSRAITFLGGPN